MLKKEKNYFLAAAGLYLILLIIIYFGSYLQYLLRHSWYGTGAVIAILFIWVSIFIIATIIVAKGVYLIKERLAGKQRLDFVTWVGVLIADYSSSGNELDLPGFFKEICKENGVMDVPDLKKYLDHDNKLTGNRDFIFDQLRQEIENAADAWSKEKKGE